MIAALKVRESALARAEEKQRLEWRHAFELTLQQSLPGVQIVGTSSNRLWNTVSALMPEARDEWRVTSAETESRHSAHSRWVVKLDKIGFAVSTGSACASGQEKPSHVLSAMGCTPAETGRVLRFSSGWETTPEDWNALADALGTVHQEMSEPRVAGCKL